MIDELEGALREFLIESSENLDQLDRDLVVLEKTPGDAGRLASVFRTVHTIKGTCGFFDFTRLGALAHAGESLLDRLRDGRIALTPGITSALLALTDRLRASLWHIEQHSAESPDDFAPLIDRLTRLAQGDIAPVETTPDPGSDDLCGGVAEGSIRVDVGMLDQLMNLVGELVLARNQILQMASAQADPLLTQASQRLNLITTELQEGVMKTRMQPIGNLWSKFPRVVRDMALSCGKTVRVSMEGQETDLDKTILEAVKGPLTHLVRNAIDHGLECPADRRKAGKPDAGLLHLRACHEGGQVVIEVADDGRGLNAARIRDKAIERGLIGAEQATRLSERDLLRLVFLPGFSTAETVTNLSGRGVGMDVVKINVEKIGGTVDIQSHPGRGTTVRLKIPLTLAIIPALIVTSGGDRYAIPQVNLLELVHLGASQPGWQIENLYGTPVYRLRGDLLPLIYLDDLLRVPHARKEDSAHLVVLQADGQVFGLVVDAIHDTEEIVVKPLGKHLNTVPLYAGATIMGDGQVVLILDTHGLIQASGMASETREQELPQTTQTPAKAENRESVLLFELGQGSRAALPLPWVTRLEEIPRDAVEQARGQPVAQCRGEILPLLMLADVFPWAGPPREGDGPLQVVVCSDNARQMGLVVDRILDIVETTLEIKLASGGGPGLLGTAVVQQRVTDLLDMQGLMALVAGRA